MNKLKNKDLISIGLLEIEEVELILSETESLKKGPRNTKILDGQTLAMIFLLKVCYYFCSILILTLSVGIKRQNSLVFANESGYQHRFIRQSILVVICGSQPYFLCQTK